MGGSFHGELLVITRWYNGDNHSGIFFMGMLHQQYRFWVWHLQFDEPPNDRWIWRCFKCGGHSQNHRVVLEFCGKCSPQTWRPKKPKAYPRISWRQHRKTSYLGWSIFWKTSFLHRFSELNLWISKKYAHKGEFSAIIQSCLYQPMWRVHQKSKGCFSITFRRTQWTTHWWGLTAICDHLDIWGGNHGRLHRFTLQ